MKCPNCGANIEGDRCEHCYWMADSMETIDDEVENLNIFEEEDKEYGLINETNVIDTPIKKRKNFTSVIMIVLTAAILIALFISINGRKEKEQSERANTVPALETSSIELYQYHNVTEEILLEELGIEKNERCTYSLGAGVVIYCLEGRIQEISISGNEPGEYTFLGVSIGDDIKEAEEKILKCFTYISSETEKDNFRNVYRDNAEGMLTIKYNMSTEQILAIKYEAVDNTTVSKNKVMEDDEKEEIEDEIEEPKAQTIEMPKTRDDIDYMQTYEFAFQSINLDEEYGTYFLWDLNDDGVCELFLGHGKTASDYMTEIWTVGEYGEAIHTFRKIDGECAFYVAPDNNGIYAVYGYMGKEKITRISVLEGVLLIETISERKLGIDEDYYKGEKVIASADITDRSLLTRISSITGAESEVQPLTYGTYVYDDGSSMICTAEVGFATGDGRDYVSIDCRGYGGHGIIEFLGYLEQNPDGSYTTVCTDYDAVLTCTFNGQGMTVKVELTEFDTLHDVEGYYDLESALDLSNAG